MLKVFPPSEKVKVRVKVYPPREKVKVRVIPPSDHMSIGIPYLAPSITSGAR